MCRDEGAGRAWLPTESGLRQTSARGCPQQGLQHRRMRELVTQVVSFIIIGSSGNLSESCILTDVDLLKMKTFCVKMTLIIYVLC